MAPPGQTQWALAVNLDAPNPAAREIATYLHDLNAHVTNDGASIAGVNVTMSGRTITVRFTLQGTITPDTAGHLQLAEV